MFIFTFVSISARQSAGLYANRAKECNKEQ